METIAIDPGKSGGLAWRDAAGCTHASPMPDGMTAQVDFLRDLPGRLPVSRAVIEKVGPMPHDGKASLAKFARHCGHLEAALYLLGIPTIQVAPGVWQRALGALPADKCDRKRVIRETMQRRFPGLRVTLKTADALAILEWVTRRTTAGAL